MWIAVLISLFSPSSADCNLEEVRDSFHNEYKTSEDLEKSISAMKSMPCSEVEPYLACAIMQMATHTYWPPSKLKYFNQGKDKLEQYIEENPSDVEARYVRLQVQQSAPSFLGYSDDITDDSNFILDNLKNAYLPDDLTNRIEKAAKKNLN